MDGPESLLEPQVTDLWFRSKHTHVCRRPSQSQHLNSIQNVWQDFNCCSQTLSTFSEWAWDSLWWISLNCVDASRKIQTKTFWSIWFLIDKKKQQKNKYIEVAKVAWTSLQSNSRFSSAPGLSERYEELYCFSYKPNVDDEERRREWAFVDLQADFSRMGLPNAQWKLSPVNQHYKVKEPTSEWTDLILIPAGGWDQDMT